MSTPVNILLGLIGVGNVTAGLASVRQGLANVNAEALRSSASSIGLAQFATVAGTAAAGLAGVKQALDLGGQLSDLSARSGASVRDLVVLERAFDNTGVGASNVARVFTLLQRAVSGFNEQGERTDTTLSRLGTSAARLRDMSAREQIAELTRGFAGIESQADRAALAVQLFGREGGQMLQLFGDSQALATAADEVGVLADRMQRNAAAFDDAGDRLSLIKARVMEMAAATTEELLPALDAAANVIKALDLGGTGTVIGGVLPSAAAAAGLAGLMSVVDRIDDRLVTATLKAGPGMAQNIGFALTSLTGLLARILPVGLAGAVFYGIYSGAISAWQASITERDRLAEEAHRKEKARIDEIAAMRTAAERDALRDRILAEMKALETKRDEVITVRTWDVDSRSSTPDAEEQRPRGLSTEEDATYRRLQSQLRVIDGERAKQIIQANQLADATAGELEAATKLSAELASQVKSHQDAAEKARFSLASDERKLALLDEIKRKAEGQLATDVAAATIAGDLEARKAAEARFEAATLQIALERKNAQERIAESKEREKKAAEAAAKAEEQAAAAARQRAQLAARNSLEGRQLEIQRDLMALDADYTRTDAEKWAARRTAMQQAVTAAVAYRDAMQAVRDAATTDEARAQGDANVMSAQQNVLQAEGSLAGLGPNPSSFIEQLRASMASLRAEWGTTSQQIAGSWGQVANTMRTSLGSAFADMILKGTSFKDAMLNFGGMVLQSFVGSMAQIVADWIMQHTVMAAIRRAFGLAGIAEKTATTATEVGIHATGEATKTAVTGTGAASRGIIRLGETAWHGIQVGIRTAAHIAGEIAQTAITVAMVPVRIAAIVAESAVKLVSAALGALAALSAIPVVGPFLGIAAMAAVFAAGSQLLKREHGGPVSAGTPYIVGEKRPEVFVPTQDGFIVPSLEQFSDLASGADFAVGNGTFSRPATPAAAGSSPMAGGGSAGASRSTTVILAMSPEDVARSQRSYVDARVARLGGNYRPRIAQL